MSNTAKRPRISLIVCITLLAVVLSFAGGFLVKRSLDASAAEASAPIVTEDLVSQRLENIGELSTVKYLYTNMARFEDSADFYGVKIPFTTKSFLVSYDGVIKAGIDVSGIGVAVEGTRITVTLPEPEILSHEIDEKSLQVFDETKNIFNQIKIEDYSSFVADQKDSIEQNAVANGLLIDAREQAKLSVRSLLSLMPGAEGYEIVF